MPEQVKAQPGRSETKAAPSATEVKQSEHAKEAREDLGITDDLMDEIDKVLEGNETIASEYVQKGGE